MAVDNTGARRSRNKKNAFQFAQVGLYVFPSDGKVPLIPRYNRADTSLKKEEIEAAVEEFMEKHEVAPAHVGATRDPEVIKRMWRKFPDAVPSISCGPSKLVVLDADQKDDGPAKMAELFAEIGGVPEGVPVNPTKSGGAHYVFADPEGKFTNKAGLLKKQYGTDVRGQGGQFVGPGSIREDGKTYGTDADRLNFLRAITSGKIPTLPEEIVELIGAQSADAQGEQVTPTQEREVIKRLEDADWEKHEHAFDAELGDYDLDGLLASNSEFRSLYNAPGADCSTNRFLAARHVMREWPDLPVEALSIFFSQWEGSGEYTDDKPKSGQYDDRQIAREWIKNQGLTKATPSNGDAFEAVEGEDNDQNEENVADISVAETTHPRLGTMFFSTDIVRAIVPDHIVENVCVPGQLGMIHGASNVGKTFTVIHKGECVVGGKPWFGRNVDQSGVLYCFGEGGEGFLNRLDAYRQRYGTNGMVVHDGIPNLGLNTAKAIKELEKAIDKANAMYAGREDGLRVKMVFIDTFAKAIAGAAENDMKEIQPILNALRALARKKGVCIILIHHSGKDTMLGARGSSALIADVDFNLEVITADEAKKRKINGVSAGQLAIIAPKMRDEAKSGLHVFKLEGVDLGVKNKWGNPVTSVVVVPIEPHSKGEALDAVDDEEPGTTPDMLTPDQNNKAEDKRQELLGTIREAMKDCSKLVGQEMQAPLAEIEKRVAKLAKLKRDSGDNYARELRKILFRGEPSELMDDGWLRYTPGSGKRPSMLTFSPRR